MMILPVLTLVLLAQAATPQAQAPVKPSNVNKATRKPTKKAAKTTPVAPVTPPPAKTAQPLEKVAPSLPKPEAINPTADPGLVAKESTVDLGEVQSPDSRTGVFTLINQGSKPVKITGVSTTCGCTAATPAKQNLAPGESTTVSATFYSHGYYGTLTRVITVQTDDTNRPALPLTLKVKVDTAYLTMPNNLYITADTENPSDATLTRDFRFAPATRIYTPKEVVLEPADAPFKVTWEPAPGGEVKGKVTLDLARLPKGPTAPQGTQSGKLVLKTKEGPSAFLNLSYRPPSNFIVSETRVQLGVVKAGTPVSKLVPILSPDGKTPFRILKVTPSRPEFEVTATLDQPSLNHTLQLNCKGLPAGQYREKISLEIDTTKKLLEVPINIVVE